MISAMMLPRFDYEAPESLADAVARLAAAGPEASVLAGGTDLLVRMKRMARGPRLVISLNRIPGLRRVTRLDGGGLRVGALATMADLDGHEALNGSWAGVAEGAAAVGGPIIRNRATVGGNIVNARPCADTVPPLIALGATLHLEGLAGRRRVDLDGFITGPGETGIGDDEILTAIDLAPAAGCRRGTAYLKLTRRAAMEVTIVGCAARVDLAEDGRTLRVARLVLASVAPVPLRAREAERALEGRVADEAVLREAAAIARAAARPIDDCRAPADYRSDIVEVLARRALGLAVARAMAGAS